MNFFTQNVDYCGDEPRSLSAFSFITAALICVLLTCSSASADGNMISAHGGTPGCIAENVDTDLFPGLIPQPPVPMLNHNVLFGWPQSLRGAVPFFGRAATVLDFDMNNDWELSVLTIENSLHVYQNDGANYPGFPLQPYQGNRPQPWVNPDHNSTSAAGDITGNGLPELVYISDIGYLHVVGEDYNQPEPFPVDIGRRRCAGVPLLSDINGNGDLDIVFNVWSTTPDSVDEEAWIYVYTNTGRNLEGWPIPYPRASSSSPAAGDINGDGDVEIVAGNSSLLDDAAHIWAWRPDGMLVEGFPAGSFQTVHGSPSLADINGDGNLEIIFWAASFDENTAGIYAYDGTGNLLENFPFSCPVGHPEGSPSIADITGDGSAEIVFGTFGQNGGSRIYAWSSQGDLLDGFPVQFQSSVVGSVLLADVSGDGTANAVAALAPGGGSSGEIIAVDSNGEIVDDFPITLDDFGGGAFAWMPTIWDIDCDRDLDIIAITTDRRVFIWNTPGLITRDVWLTCKGDMKRSGMRPADNPNHIPGGVEASLPEKSIASAYPNPFNSSVRIRFDSESAVGGIEVRVYDVNGGLVTSVPARRVSRTGWESVFDAGKFNLSAGLYLCRWDGSRSGTLKLLYMP